MESELAITMAKIALSIFAGGFTILLLYVYGNMVLTPKRLRSKLQKQGIRGPSPSLLLGNIPQMKKIQLDAHSKPTTTSSDHLNGVASISHEWPSEVLSHLLQWRHQYGLNFVHSMGNVQYLCITDVEVVKEVSIITSLSMGKPLYLSKVHGKVKGMVKMIVESTKSMIRSWESKIESKGIAADIEVSMQLRGLSGDIISKACFGSSYLQGEHIFLKLRALQKLLSTRLMGIPGSRFVPSKNNFNTWKLEKKINEMILTAVKQRSEASDEKDLLQMILEGAKLYDGAENMSLGITHDKFIVDNCKSIYFAGHETTALTASWVLMLMAMHPKWQTRVREEVQGICRGGDIADISTLRNMKMLKMVIQETLRLYPPVVMVTRKVSEDIQLKNILIPKGVHIQIPIPILHQDPDLWGPDSHEFKPERFENGIIGACKAPQAYIPFGLGPRICVGQHLAMAELKVILSLLSDFSFSISPTYRHSPAFRLIVEPEHGINLLVERI